MPEIQHDPSLQGGATTAETVRSRLKALTKSRAFVITLSVLLLASALGLGYYLHRFKSASLTVVNLRPCKIVFAVHRPATEAQSVTEGWWTLEPGQKVTLERGFDSVAPGFAVYGESRCPELTRWVHKIPDKDPATEYFEGGPGDTVSYLFIRPESQPAPQAEAKPDDKTDPQRTATMEVRSVNGVEVAPQEGMELVGFVKVPTGKSPEFLHAIYDHNFEGLYVEDGLPADDDDLGRIEVFAKRAALLAKSLDRQRRFDQNWPNPARSFPYELGLEIRDHNGMDMPGLLVEDVLISKTIFGDDVPFQPGDILQEFSGEPIFSGLDLNMLLYEHATSLEKGIEVPIEFKLVRGNQVIAGEALYFFNPAYWGEQNRLKVFGAATLNTVAFGGGATAEALIRKGGRGLLGLLKRAVGDDTPEEGPPPPDFKEERWKIAQRNALYQQLESGTYDAGSVAGMFTPSAPRLLFTKVLAKNIARKGVPRLVAHVTAATTLEVAEGVMWTVGNASPVAKPEQIAEDIRRWAPYSAGVGVVSGAFTRRRVRK